MSLIKQLINPNNENFFKFKSYANGNEIDWKYQPNSIPPNSRYELPKKYGSVRNYKNVPFYSHIIFERPWFYDMNDPLRTLNPEGNMFPTVRNGRTFDEYIRPFLYDLMLENKGTEECKINCILRCNLNCCHSELQGFSIPHKDHFFPHRNMLFYLNDAGGETVVGDEHFSPKEGDIITFDSSEFHYMHPPKSGRRIIMVLTYI